MATLSATALPTEKVRFSVGLFLFSGLLAQIVLLLQFSLQQSLPAAFALAGVLAIAFAGGYIGSRWEAFLPTAHLTRIRLGFLISAAGLLCLILAFRGMYSWHSLMPGVIVSGLGQGIVSRAIAGKRNGNAVSARFAKSRAGVMTTVALLSSGICLAIPLQFAGLSGFPYAFALLLDLSLLGALYIKITEDDL